MNEVKLAEVEARLASHARQSAEDSERFGAVVDTLEQQLRGALEKLGDLRVQHARAFDAGKERESVIFGDLRALSGAKVQDGTAPDSESDDDETSSVSSASESEDSDSDGDVDMTGCDSGDEKSAVSVKLEMGVGGHERDDARSAVARSAVSVKLEVDVGSHERDDVSSAATSAATAMIIVPRRRKRKRKQRRRSVVVDFVPTHPLVEVRPKPLAHLTAVDAAPVPVATGDTWLGAALRSEAVLETEREVFSAQKILNCGPWARVRQGYDRDAWLTVPVDLRLFEPPATRQVRKMRNQPRKTPVPRKAWEPPFKMKKDGYLKNLNKEECIAMVRRLSNRRNIA